MKYQSTRGGVSGLGFKEAVVMGLATDGGLLVPHKIPDVSHKLNGWTGLSFNELALNIMSEYISDIPRADLEKIIEQSYSTFDVEKVTPVVEVGGLHVLELFHGPTLAFKDVALQFLGNVFEYILEKENRHLNILGATSGDTGSAAIEAVRGKPRINIFILFPEGKTSPVQEKQMTTVLDENVFNIGIEGNFDDCQNLIKSIFNDLPFKAEYQLGAVNSVNWARILAQVVYYFYAWYELDMPKSLDVAVPTGNFGDIFAGYLARSMGLPINKLILATNSNDILSRFFNTGIYQRAEVHFTDSPAMDIQVSSNFERYLYYKLDESGEKVSDFFEKFLKEGTARLNFNTKSFDESFIAGSANDAETRDTIRRVYEENDYLVDPHTAVGIHVGSQHRTEGIPLLCLSTAHPAKFEDVIRRSIPEMVPHHPTLDALEGMPTKKENLDADIDQVKAFIKQHSEPDKNPH
jgi:threonine synthase